MRNKSLYSRMVNLPRMRLRPEQIQVSFTGLDGLIRAVDVVNLSRFLKGS